MVLVEEIVLSLQRIFSSVSQVLASVPYQSPNPTNSSYLQLHEWHTWTRLVRNSECLHLEPTRQLFQKKRVCYIWTRYSWQISIFNHQKASVKHLDPTCRRIDIQTSNWKITEATQKSKLNQPENQEHPLCVV